MEVATPINATIVEYDGTCLKSHVPCPEGTEAKEVKVKKVSLITSDTPTCFPKIFLHPTLKIKAFVAIKTNHTWRCVLGTDLDVTRTALAMTMLSIGNTCLGSLYFSIRLVHGHGLGTGLFG